MTLKQRTQVPYLLDIFFTPFTGHACLTLRSRLQCDFIQRDKDDKTKNNKSRYLVS